MKTKSLLPFIALALFTTSCGFFNKSPEKEEPKASSESTQEMDLFASENNSESGSHFDGPSNVDNTSSTTQEQQEISSLGPNETQVATTSENPSYIDQAAHASTMPEEKVSDSLAMQPLVGPSTEGEIKSVVVKKGETLMQIAFRIYGDVTKWRELARLNKSALTGNLPKKGLTLKYAAPAVEFNWNPEGVPYLIQSGDTLGVISNKVYQTPKKWKMIWENNKPLIKNPNVIYAGFTLYYKELSKLADSIVPSSRTTTTTAKAITNLKAENETFADLVPEGVETEVSLPQKTEENTLVTTDETIQNNLEAIENLNNTTEEINVEQAATQR